MCILRDIKIYFGGENTMKLQLAASMAVLALFSASPVLANTVEQDQTLKQEFEVDCESGSYGSQNCHVSGKQEGSQYQKVAFVSDSVLGYTTRDAGLNTPLMAVAGLIMLAGVGAAAYQLKSRAKQA